MHYEAMFKGEYIAAVELGDKKPTLTIKKVALVEIPDDDGKSKTRGVVYFHQTDRGWVLNRTNASLLAAMFGPETDNWAGKRVTLHAVEVQFGPKKVPGIRVLGSPDIERPITTEVKLPRRKPLKMKLVPTGKGAPNHAPEPEPAPEEEAEFDGIHGEESDHDLDSEYPA